MTPHPDEQAREWLDTNEPIFGYVSDRKIDALAALLARVQLAEAESLQVFIHVREKHIPVLRPEQCQFQICVDILERIASLRQAAGERTT